MLGVNITNRAGYGVKKPTTTVFLHFSIETEFEGITRGVLNVTKVARFRLFLDMDENYYRHKRI